MDFFVCLYVILAFSLLCLYIPHIKASLKYGASEFLHWAKLEHISGLNFPCGTKCSTVFLKGGIVFTAFNQEYILDQQKLVSVSLMNHKEIQRQYVSSAGGAIAGAMLLGPLGAIIGGSASLRSISNRSKYLVIAYKDFDESAETKYILFDVTKNGTYQGVLRHYRNLNRTPTQRNVL